MLDHHFLMVEAACGGLEVGLAPRVVAIDDVDRGRLEAPVDFAPDGTRYGLLPAFGIGPNEHSELLCEWLRGMSAEL